MDKAVLSVRQAAENLHSMARQLAELPLPATDDVIDATAQANRAALAELAQADQTEFRLVVMGEFSSGKSTFINAFIGRRVVKTAATIETAHISIFRYGAPEGAVFVLRDGSQLAQTVDAALNLLEDQGQRSDLLDQLSHVEFTLSAPGLQNFVLVDTPGLATVQQHHEDLTQREIDRANAVLWVFDAYQPGSASERDYLESLEGQFVLGLLNKYDTVDEDEREEVLKACRDTAPDVLRDVLPLSAWDALEAIEAENETALVASGMLAVRDYLQVQVVGQEDLIQAAGRSNKLSDLCQQLYTLLSDRRQSAKRGLAGVQQAAQLLDQRREALRDRVARELINCNIEFGEELKRQLADYVAHFTSSTRDIGETVSWVVEHLLPRAVISSHHQALQDRAQAELDRSRLAAHAELEALSAQLLKAVPTVPIILAFGGIDDQQDRVLYIGAPTAIGVAAGAAAAAASTAIAWTAAVSTGGIGLAVGLLAYQWRSAQQLEKFRGAVRVKASEVLTSFVAQTEESIRRDLVPAVMAADDANRAALLASASQTYLGGHTPDEVQAALVHVDGLERDLRRVAQARDISLAGLVEFSAPDALPPRFAP